MKLVSAFINSTISKQPQYIDYLKVIWNVPSILGMFRVCSIKFPQRQKK